jgi:hypothetical protein
MTGPASVWPAVPRSEIAGGANQVAQTAALSILARWADCLTAAVVVANLLCDPCGIEPASHRKREAHIGLGNRSKPRVAPALTKVPHKAARLAERILTGF